jgi:hypothetical protein
MPTSAIPGAGQGVALTAAGTAAVNWSADYAHGQCGGGRAGANRAI